MRKSDGTVAAWIGATSREFTDEDAVACTLPFPIYLYGNHNEARPAIGREHFLGNSKTARLDRKHVLKVTDTSAAARGCASVMANTDLVSYFEGLRVSGGYGRTIARSDIVPSGCYQGIVGKVWLLWQSREYDRIPIGERDFADTETTR